MKQVYKSLYGCKELLLIIPAYNEANCLPRVLVSLQQLHFCDYIIINDGSVDDTISYCDKNSLPCINLPVNLGLAGALQTGFQYAKKHGYIYAAQFDGDGQHLGEYVAPLLQEIKKGYDIVVGSRCVESGSGNKSLRSFGSSLLSWAIYISTGHKITDPTSGMRVYNRKMINLFAEGFNFGPEPDTMAYLIRSGAAVKEVGVKMCPRFAGNSYLSALNALKYMLRMTISILIVQFVRNKVDLEEDEKE